MAANTSPIYSRLADIQWCSLTAANNVYDGTGTTGTVFTADATNGGRVEQVRLRPLGGNVATVVRLFINNGSSSAVAANNSLYCEVSMAASAASATTALTEISVQAPFFPLVLPPGYKILALLGTAVAGGIAITAAGGKY